MALDDMMNVKEVMIDDAFHKIEEAPAEEAGAEESFARPRHVSTGSAFPKKAQPDECHGIGERMKQPVPEHVDLHVGNAGLGILRRQHVVCLEQLMEQDAIEESSEADAHKSSSNNKRLLV